VSFHPWRRRGHPRNQLPDPVLTSPQSRSSRPTRMAASRRTAVRAPATAPAQVRGRSSGSTSPRRARRPAPPLRFPATTRMRRLTWMTWMTTREPSATGALPSMASLRPPPQSTPRSRAHLPAIKVITPDQDGRQSPCAPATAPAQARGRSSGSTSPRRARRPVPPLRFPATTRMRRLTWMTTRQPSATGALPSMASPRPPPQSTPRSRAHLPAIKVVTPDQDGRQSSHGGPGPSDGSGAGVRKKLRLHLASARSPSRTAASVSGDDEDEEVDVDDDEDDKTTIRH
jgi:hypothetical protein